jgi:Gram-negative porin
MNVNIKQLRNLMAIRYYLIALLGFFASTAKAETIEANPPLDKPMFTFGGFGSIGVSHSSMKSGDYVLDSSVPQGPGLSQNWSTTNDSRIAGHLAAQFTPRISAVLQVDSEYHSGNTYSPEVEYANVKFELTRDASIRAGRMSLPTFLESENRDIGYTYVWIHPPIEVYRQEPTTHCDCVDVDYRLQIGEVGNSLKAIYGSSTIETNDFHVSSDELSSKNLWGIFDTVENGPTTIHAGYQQRQTDSEYLLTGDNGDIRESDLSFGVQYDPGDWFAMSEWIQHKSTYKNSAMYVSAGYRVKKFTPYATYAQSNSGSFLTGFPPPTPEAIALANRAQSTVSLGVRWDFMRNTDFKFQYDQATLSDSSNGYLANVPPGVTLYGSKFHVISAVIDFIF